MLDHDHGLPVVPEPRADRPVRSASCERAGDHRRPVARGGTRRPAVRTRPLGRARPRSGCAPTRSSSTLFLYVPIVVVVMFAFNGTDRRSPTGRGFSTEAGSASPSADEVVRKSLWSTASWSAIPNAILATTFGTMAALGLQRARKQRPTHVRRADLHRASSCPRSSSPCRRSSCSRPGSTSSEDAHRAGAEHRPPDDHRGPRPVQHSASCLLLVRARLSGIDRTHVEASADLLRHALADVPSDDLPAAPARPDRRRVSCCRSPSASTTSSSRRSCPASDRRPCRCSSSAR